MRPNLSTNSGHVKPQVEIFRGAYLRPIGFAKRQVGRYKISLIKGTARENQSWRNRDTDTQIITQSP